MTTPKRPLEIGCNAHTCGKGLLAGTERHAFASPVGTLPGAGGGHCVGCSQSGLVDWERCHQRDPDDRVAVFAQLDKELIRHNYLTQPLPEHILRKAHKRTQDQLGESARRLLRRELRQDNPRAGFQTPWAYKERATILHCAQHATACCCRACAEKWFAIPTWRPLGEREIDFLTAYVMEYVERRMSDERELIVSR